MPERWQNLGRNREDSEREVPGCTGQIHKDLVSKISKGIKGMIKTTEHFPVKLDYFYIVSFEDFLKPKLLPVYFVNKNAAKRVLKSNVGPKAMGRFRILSGRVIRNEHIPYVLGFGVFGQVEGKYPLDKKMTPQEKKSLRTMVRRRLRRMGILSTNKAKFRLNERVKMVKYKPNTQIVAQNKNSDAKVFQLDRKPSRYYYILIRKSLSKKSGKLFRLLCIQVNIKTGAHKKMVIHSKRNDIFIPHLLEELKKLPNTENAIRAYYDHKNQQEKAI
jgi:hypothetical protein